MTLYDEAQMKSREKLACRCDSFGLILGFLAPILISNRNIKLSSVQFTAIAAIGVEAIPR
jgi:hypothetical protein